MLWFSALTKAGLDWIRSQAGSGYDHSLRHGPHHGSHHRPKTKFGKVKKLYIIFLKMIINKK